MVDYLYVLSVGDGIIFRINTVIYAIHLNAIVGALVFLPLSSIFGTSTIVWAMYGCAILGNLVILRQC